MQHNPINEALKIVFRTRHCKICLTPEQAEEFLRVVGEHEFTYRNLGSNLGNEERRYLIEAPRYYFTTLTYRPNSPGCWDDDSQGCWVVAPYRSRRGDIRF